jgi:hypothetical protein
MAFVLASFSNRLWPCLIVQLTGASAKGTWIRLLHPPIEGRLESGFEGMDVGHGLRVQCGYIDFKKVV